MNYIAKAQCLISMLVLSSTLAQADNALIKLQTYIEPTIHPCLTSDVTGEQLCKNMGKEHKDLFNTKPILDTALQIDIRPKNCLSFFDDYLDTRRGLRIESALSKSEFYRHLKSTVSTFPVVDFITDGQARVVKTRDLAADSFNDEENSNALYNQILKDAEEINTRLVMVLENESTITATVNGEYTEIKPGDINEIFLDIVVQTGLATESQTSQIIRAKNEIYRRWAIQLQLIEIP